ncbi:hypothetical protein M5D96_005073 [Drosophila gunungcola]|uniref:UDP-glucuronosyltransferase n=1 Tax=Drosophila gunungcola TaxID=103775 RepID=A0A9P9YV56_9MUSC|nr:hypothetical protein M5D96_005073 [Drosophila gunungcola]
MCVWKGFCLLALLSLVVYSDSLRILGLFPHPAMSHFKFFHPIMRGLAEAGHSVDVISPFEDKDPPKGYKDYLLPPSTLTDTIHLEDFERPFHYLFHYIEYFVLYNMGKEDCNTTLHSAALSEILKNPPGYYDVILLEQFNTDCAMGVAHVLQAPVIGMSSCALMPWHYERLGAPLIPSYISALFQGQSQEMSLAVPAANALIRQRFGPGLPSTEDMVRNTSLMLVNQHFSLSGPKPLPPNVIEVGGVHIRPPEPLPSDLQKILDNASKGVILISWGSQLKMSSLPAARRDGIVRALGRLEQQRDILAHPNLRVFMSHGGLMGTTEAVSSAVPIVGVPIYGDQSLNIAALVHRGMALQLEFKKLDENTVFEALTKALDPSFKERAKEVASAYNNRIQDPLETAIWWVEHVAETKGASLTQPKQIGCRNP